MKTILFGTSIILLTLFFSVFWPPHDGKTQPQQLQLKVKDTETNTPPINIKIDTAQIAEVLEISKRNQDKTEILIDKNRELTNLNKQILKEAKKIRASQHRKIYRQIDTIYSTEVYNEDGAFIDAYSSSQPSTLLVCDTLIQCPKRNFFQRLKYAFFPGK